MAYTLLSGSGGLSTRSSKASWNWRPRGSQNPRLRQTRSASGMSGHLQLLRAALPGRRWVQDMSFHCAGAWEKQSFFPFDFKSTLFLDGGTATVLNILKALP